MGGCINKGRRGFLKKSAMSAAGVAVGSIAPKVFAESAAFTAINPDIDNMRVVYMHNTGFNSGSTVSSTAVEAGLDKMAQALAQKADVDEAWGTIFQLPAGKTWSTVKVGFKVNNLSTFKPSPKVTAAVCKALNSLGVPYTNMYIYDTVGGNTTNKGSTSGLPSGVQKPSIGWTTVTIPSYSTKYPCVNLVAKSEVDILVNISVNKGHSEGYGRATLCLKNHFGTFDPIPFGSTKTADTHGSFDYLIRINKSDVLVGGTTPCQQVCIVDTIFSAKNGPSVSSPDANPAYLVMGTFGPAVDYQTVKKIREVTYPTYDHYADGGGSNGGPLQQGTPDEWVTDFGYSTSSPEWINASTYTPPTAIVDRVTGDSAGLLQVASVSGGYRVTSRQSGVFTLHAPDGKKVFRQGVKAGSPFNVMAAGFGPGVYVGSLDYSGKKAIIKLQLR